jgi:hypothetical protein
MKYALLIYTKPDSMNGYSDDERAALTAEYAAVGSDPGVLGGEQLLPISTATTVRVSDGQTLTTDGPFADTKEVFAGFLFQADNIDKAIEIAGRIPAARMGGSVGYGRSSSASRLVAVCGR